METKTIQVASECLKLTMPDNLGKLLNITADQEEQCTIGLTTELRARVFTSCQISTPSAQRISHYHQKMIRNMLYGEIIKELSHVQEYICRECAEEDARIIGNSLQRIINRMQDVNDVPDFEE